MPPAPFGHLASSSANSIRVAVKRPADRERWTSTRFVLYAFSFNGLCLVVLLANLLTGNVWWRVAVPIAVGCLFLGGLAGFQARRLRLKGR